MESVKKYLNKATNTKQIEQILKRPVKMLSYKDLQNKNSIFDCFNKYGEFILHLPSSEIFGHWICCFIRPDGDIEVFNSYGGIDSDIDLDSMKKYYESICLELYPHLTELLLHCGRKIHYNDKQLQSWGTATCGRWCAYRLKHKDVPIDTFSKSFIKVAKDCNIKPDELLLLALNEHGLLF